MVIEGFFQFLAAFLGTCAFAVLFSVPRKQYLLCGTIGGGGWLVCWCCIHCFHTGVVEANFVATLFIALVSRIASTVRKCPVTLFLISGIFPEVPGLGIYRTVYFSMLNNRESSMFYGRETLGIAIAMVLGIILVFEIPQKTINRIARR